MKSLLFTLLFFAFTSASGQKNAVSFQAWEGVIVAGYSHKGAFVNFAGPGVKWTRKPFTLLAGVLPSVKIKEDSSPVKNALLTPSLGAGLTLSVKKLVVQLPFYYISKTTTESGRWKGGLGVGYKF